MQMNENTKFRMMITSGEVLEVEEWKLGRTHRRLQRLLVMFLKVGGIYTGVHFLVTAIFIFTYVIFYIF